jgi:hypothetical protein
MPEPSPDAYLPADRGADESVVDALSRLLLWARGAGWLKPLADATDWGDAVSFRAWGTAFTAVSWPGVGICPRASRRSCGGLAATAPTSAESAASRSRRACWRAESDEAGGVGGGGGTASAAWALARCLAGRAGWSCLATGFNSSSRSSTEPLSSRGKSFEAPDEDSVLLAWCAESAV